MKSFYIALFGLLSVINFVYVNTIKADSSPISITLGEEFESTDEHNVFKYTNANDKEFLFHIKCNVSDSSVVDIYNDKDEDLLYSFLHNDNYLIGNFTINIGETAYIKINKDNVKATVTASDTQIKATINNQVMDKMIVKLDRGNSYNLGFIIYDEILNEFVDYSGEIKISNVSMNLYPATGNLIVIPEYALVGYDAIFRVETVMFCIQVK